MPVPESPRLAAIPGTPRSFPRSAALLARRADPNRRPRLGAPLLLLLLLLLLGGLVYAGVVAGAQAPAQEAAQELKEEGAEHDPHAREAKLREAACGR